MRRGILIGLCLGALAGGGGFAAGSVMDQPACAAEQGDLGLAVRSEQEAAKALRKDIARLKDDVAFLSGLVDKQRRGRGQNKNAKE